MKERDPGRFLLTVAYDGTAYAGWQCQKTGLGVQEKVEEALRTIFGSAIRLHSSSRTDTGVHALAMPAHFEVPAGAPVIPPGKLVLALNGILPDDIRVQGVKPVGMDFHARFQAARKQYRYFIWNEGAMNPLLRHFTWHVPVKLQLDRMAEAARHFTGRQDYRSFAGTRRYAPSSTVRTIYRCEVLACGNLLMCILEADGFLYKMCRGIVGTLVQAGQEKFQTAQIKNMLNRRDRKAAGMTAPARGRVLWKVFYPGGDDVSSSEDLDAAGGMLAFLRQF